MKPLVYALAVACVLFGSILLAFFLGGLSRAPSSRPAMSDHEPGIRASPRAGLEEEQPSSVPSTKKERGQDAAKTTQGEAAEQPAAVSQGPLPIPRGKSELIFEVTDSSSQPLAGVVVTLLSGRAARDATSRADGTAAFSNIKEDTYSYRVRGEGFPELVSAREVVLSFGEHKRIRLKLGAFNLSISGRVLDRSGRPVPGVVVYARKQALAAGEADLLPFDSDELKGESRLDGAYDISGLEAGDYLLSTESQSGLPLVRKVYRAGIQTADIILDSLREIEVSGVVASPDGTALEKVLIQPAGQTARQAQSDAQGRYVARIGLGEEQTSTYLTATKEGYRDARVNIQLEDLGSQESLEVNISMEPLGARARVTGVLLDTERSPVRGEAIYLHSAALNARYQAASDGSGHFAFGEVQVGSEYRLWVYPRQGFKDYSVPALDVPETGLELEVVLEPIETGSLRGAMVDSLGAPVPNFTLWLRSLKALGNSLAVTSDAGGRFEVDKVPEGDLIFETRSLPMFNVRGLQLKPGGEKQVTILLDWGSYQLSGTVVEDEGGSPVAGAAVSMYWARAQEGAQSSSSRSTVTDAQGRFSFSELGSGEHKINVLSTKHKQAQTTYNVGGDAPEPTIRLRSK